MNISNDMIDKAIKECQWRNTEMGVAICNGNINLCSLEIEHGKCETLRQLFNGTSEQGLFKKENDYVTSKKI